MSNRLKGIIMAAGSASLWGLLGIFTRALNAAEYTSLEIAYLRCLLTGVGLLILHGIKNPQVLRVGKQGVLTSIIFGVLTYTAGFLGYAFSIERIPVAMSAVLSFMSPVWVCLIGLVVFRERVQRKQVISIAFCLLGAVLITNLLGVQEMRFDMLGMLAATLNGVGIAAQVSVPRYFSGRYERDTMLTYGFLGASAFMALFVDHGKILHSFVAPGGLSVIFNVLCLGIPCTLVANTCFVKSACYVKPTTSCILSALEVVVSTIVGFLLFQENLTALQLLGGAIIVAASLGMELLGHANPPALEEKGTDAGNETAVKPR